MTIGLVGVVFELWHVSLCLYFLCCFKNDRIFVRTFMLEWIGLVINIDAAFYVLFVFWVLKKSCVKTLLNFFCVPLREKKTVYISSFMDWSF